MHIRSYQTGDEPALWNIFHSAVHQLAASHYTPEQLHAWAPDQPDWPAWTARMQALQPFVLIAPNGQPAGYADLQPNGYIDHFFIAPSYARIGAGKQLMQYLQQLAKQRGLKEINADVSLNAQPFFMNSGFVLVRQQQPVIRGVVLANAHMRQSLKPSLK